jgi:hypothetical protein
MWIIYSEIGLKNEEKEERLSIALEEIKKGNSTYSCGKLFFEICSRSFD